MSTLAGKKVDPWQLGVRDLLCAYRGKIFDPTFVVRSCLGRIEAVDSEIHAVVDVLADGLAAADLSTRLWEEGSARPIEGIPFGVKDLMGVVGTQRSAGSPRLRGVFPSGDAECVAQLRQVGGIPLVTLRTYELALCGDNPALGVARNPYNCDHHPGGSSSGSAASVAAGEIPFALGTDTGGSVRLPAAWCGVAGLKPTTGLISLRGVTPLAPSFDAVGLIARRVSDLEALLGVWAPIGTESHDQPITQPERVRVGVWRLGQALCHPAVSSALGKAADLLEGIGYQVIEVDLPSGDQIAHAFWQVLLAEARNEHQSFIAESLVEGPVADTLRSGKDLSSPVIEESWAALNRYSRSFEARCESVDLVLLPSSIGPAPRLADGLLETARGGRHWTDNAFDSMVFANILGWPALSVPVNVCDDLPIGLQLTGRRYSDYAVLKVGAEIDRELPSPVLRTVF